MTTHNIEIEIRPDGEVKVHIQGVKGKKCMAYLEFLKSIVGEVKKVDLTHEYYEPEENIEVNLERQRVRQRR